MISKKEYSVFVFPKPTGNFAVGTTSFYFKDENRKEIHSENENDKRELLIQVWYPAENENRSSLEKYDSTATKIMLNRDRDIPFEKLKILEDVFIHAKKNAAPKNDSNYPVILFMPGFGCNANNNTANCEELASQGYVVVGINPTYAASIAKFPDGRIIKHKNINVLDQKTDDLEQQVWLDDAVFILDQLPVLNENSILKGMLNLEKIGTFGHSYGGSTAAQLCRVDKRCKAGISLDGGLFGKNPTESFNKKFLFILAEVWPWNNYSDDKLKEMNVTKEQYENLKKKWVEYIPQLCNSLGKDAHKMVIKNAKHNAFSDSALFKEIPELKSFDLDVGSINGFKMIEILNEAIVGFFDKYLKNSNA